MESQVTVWNVDARNRPELEVEIEIVYQRADIPGLFLATLRPELEVEITIVSGVFDGHDAWFLSDDEIVAVDDYAMAI